MELLVNIDHVATLRNTRNTIYPTPSSFAKTAIDSGANGVVVHLREDRRHIRNYDVEEIKNRKKCFLI